MGWIDPQLPVTQWTNLQIFVAAVAFLQLFAVILNLFPVPPLDGFGIIGPWLDVDCVTRMSRAAWWGLRTAARPG